MSFGYGVGDLLTLPVLAVQVYSAYKDAPDGYKHISEDVKSLQTIIDDAVKYLQNNALSDSKRREGQEALHSCRGVLEDLNALLEKYKSLVSTNKMQVFKRVKLGNEDIMTLRDRLVSSSIFLTNFIRSCELFEMEARLEARWSNVLGLRRTSSRASLNSVASFATGTSINTKDAYKKLFKELHKNGVTADMINGRGNEILGLFGPQTTTIATTTATATTTTATGGQRIQSQNSGNAHLPIPVNKTLTGSGTRSGTSPTRTQLRARLGWARPPMDFLYGPAMLAAATSGDTNRLVNALKNIRNIDFMDDNKETALFKAVLAGHTDIVRLLLQKGASIKVINESTGSTPLHLAAMLGHIDIVQLLLQHGASIEAINKTNTTPLQHAASEGHAIIVELLLEKGALIETIDHFNRTPLLNAVHNGHIDTVELLLQKGASLDASDTYGNAPLHLAALNGHTAMVLLLLCTGASVEAYDKSSSTPLHLAAYNGHTATVQLLLEKGASTEVVNQQGSTALHYAAFYGHADTVQLLLWEGASIETINKGSSTPLRMAEKYGHTATIKLLLDERGASVNAINGSASTPSSRGTHLTSIPEG